MVTGYSYDSTGNFFSVQNIRTIKYDGATGAQLWSSAYVGTSSSRAYAIAISGAGHVFITGESSDGLSGGSSSGAQEQTVAATTGAA